MQRFEEIDDLLPCKIFRNDLAVLSFWLKLSRHCCWQLPAKERVAGYRGLKKKMFFCRANSFGMILAALSFGLELSRHCYQQLPTKDRAAGGCGFGEQRHFAAVRCHWRLENSSAWQAEQRNVDSDVQQGRAEQVV